MKKDRVGEVFYNNFGSKMIINEYLNCEKVKVYFEEYDWTSNWVQYINIKEGRVQCPYESRICEIGFVGEGIYSKKNNYKIYNEWCSMLHRCYDDKVHKRQPAYAKCETYKDWHNFQNYAQWREENYYEVNGEIMCLDKDILHKGNKIYSPKNCIFVPERINALFTKSDKVRGDYPIGVIWHKRDEIFEARMSYLDENNKKCRKYLGRFNTSEEAFQVYKVAKEKYIKEVADEYKPYIPKELYDAMYRYEVEIND